MVEGLRKAKQMGAKAIALAGGNGGIISREADLAIVVPSADTPRTQEGHIAIGHVICEIVESSLCG